MVTLKSRPPHPPATPVHDPTLHSTFPLPLPRPLPPLPRPHPPGGKSAPCFCAGVTPPARAEPRKTEPLLSGEVAFVGWREGLSKRDSGPALAGQGRGPGGLAAKP